MNTKVPLNSEISWFREIILSGDLVDVVLTSTKCDSIWQEGVSGLH